MVDKYTYIIVALLPLTSLMLVCQQNPYHALVIRAILGAIAALVYAVLGGSDVALTEALVGTMLAVTLYVIAVRSSLIMRLGIVSVEHPEQEDKWQEVVTSFNKVLHQHHLRLELVEYPNDLALQKALVNQEIHATCIKQKSETSSGAIYQAAFRVQRLFEIMQQELKAPETNLTYVPVNEGERKH